MSSYSFHISSKSHAIKNTKSLNSVFKHNLRKYKNEKNYDKNLILELEKTDVKSAADFKKYFNNLFFNEVIDYNSKQKRDDRKILDYFEKIEQDLSKDLAVEIIIQIADKKFWEENKDKRNLMIDVYKKQLFYLKTLVPNFYITNAILHLDEASPHLHVLGIPKSSDYKKGLSAQCSKTKIFNKEKLLELQEKMRENAQQLMKENVIQNFEFRQKEKGRNFDYTKEKIIELKKSEEVIRDVKKELRNELYDDVVEDIKQTETENLKNQVQSDFYNDLDMQNELKKQAKLLLLEKYKTDKQLIEEVKEKFENEVLEKYRKNWSTDESREKLKTFALKKLVAERMQDVNIIQQAKEQAIIEKKNEFFRESLKDEINYDSITNDVIKEIKDLKISVSQDIKQNLELKFEDYLLDLVYFFEEQYDIINAKEIITDVIYKNNADIFFELVTLYNVYINKNFENFITFRYENIEKELYNTLEFYANENNLAIIKKSNTRNDDTNDYSFNKITDTQRNKYSR
jgi:hypothetical protein